MNTKTEGVLIYAWRGRHGVPVSKTDPREAQRDMDAGRC